MNLLLDSHVFLWWIDDSAKLTARMREAIANPRNTVLVSAATIWELGLKIAIGRLTIRHAKADRLDELIDACGFDELPVRAGHAAASARLPPHHNDPFDRLLIAQALYEKADLVTVDAAIGRYDVPIFRA